MRNLPVHWSEGLFLRPHHFQAAERHWAETLAASQQMDLQYHYGVRHIEISEEAIANQQCQINRCQARMKDGTLVLLEPGQDLDRVDLKEALARSSVVRVYLGVPKLSMGRPNVAVERDGGKQRYSETSLSVQDESFGGNDQELQFRALNVRVLLSTQDLEGYELLPVAQIERAGEKEAVPRIDHDYFPPMVAIDAWPPLARGVVRAIYDIIGKKIELLASQVINRGISFASQQPGDLDRLMMLSQLNAAYATLDVLTFALGIHPLHAYTELVRIVGQLSVFGDARRPPEIPHYDHDDLARIFYWVKRQIELLLERIKPPHYEQRFFVGDGPGMAVSLESKWLGADWQWYVGVLRGELTQQEVIELLAQGKLDWKFGSSRSVDALFKYAAPGLTMKALTQAPPALPPSQNWVYYEVSKQGPPWRDVLETQTLAMRFNVKLIQNQDSLQGARQLIVSRGGHQVPLEIALFAVPVNQ